MSINIHPPCSISQHQKINTTNAQRYLTHQQGWREKDNKRLKSLWHLSNLAFIMLRFLHTSFFWFIFNEIVFFSLYAAQSFMSEIYLILYVWWVRQIGKKNIRMCKCQQTDKGSYSKNKIHYHWELKWTFLHTYVYLCTRFSSCWNQM